MKKINLLFLSLLLISGCNKTSSLKNSSIDSISSSCISNSLISESNNSSSENTISSSISSSRTESTSSSSSIIKELNSPSLSIDQNGVVTFEKIDNALYYEYIINAGEINSTFNNVIELNDKENVSVRAVNDYAYSEWSNAITFYDTSDIVLEGDGNYHKVYFHNTNYEPIDVLSNTKIDKPNDPYKEHHTFDNWYCDPFYQTVFDFNLPIMESTIIYANYIKSDLINDVYFWIKANDKMTSNIQSSNSSWRFIPLKLKENSSIKEFEAIVNVNNASASDPCKFLVMDGFDDLDGRTYYKNNNEDFKITNNGTYKITFSVETLYLLNGNEVNVKYEVINNTLSLNLPFNLELETPEVEVDIDNNRAYWNKIDKANSYEVIINNGISKIINTNSINLDKKEHISIRAIGENSYSKWSIPKANINYIYQDKEESSTHAFVYFYDSNLDAFKVEKNTYVNSIELFKEGYEFKGWYLDLAKTKKVSFPYLVTDNVIFYPKWEMKDILTKEYYSLIDSSNNKVCGLTWNIDNYDFYEYETPSVYLLKNETYYIINNENNNRFGPYSVDSDNEYIIYFSEEHIWDVNTDKASNIYIALQEVYFYFTNALNWSGTIYAYLWNDNSNEYYKSWPGVEMEFAKRNSYGQDIYKVNVDLNKYTHIIFSNGSAQTIDLSLEGCSNNSAFYTKSETENGKYKCGTYTYS